MLRALGSGRDSERCAAGILQIVRAAACSRTRRLRFRLRAAAAAFFVGLSLTSAGGGAPSEIELRLYPVLVVCTVAQAALIMLPVSISSILVANLRVSSLFKLHSGATQVECQLCTQWPSSTGLFERGRLKLNQNRNRT